MWNVNRGLILLSIMECFCQTINRNPIKSVTNGRVDEKLRTNQRISNRWTQYTEGPENYWQNRQLKKNRTKDERNGKMFEQAIKWFINFFSSSFTNFFLSVLAQNRFLLENREQSECVVSVDSVVCHWGIARDGQSCEHWRLMRSSPIVSHCMSR